VTELRGSVAWCSYLNNIQCTFTQILLPYTVHIGNQWLFFLGCGFDGFAVNSDTNTALPR